MFSLGDSHHLGRLKKPGDLDTLDDLDDIEMEDGDDDRTTSSKTRMARW